MSDERNGTYAYFPQQEMQDWLGQVEREGPATMRDAIEQAAQAQMEEDAAKGHRTERTDDGLGIVIGAPQEYPLNVHEYRRAVSWWPRVVAKVKFFLRGT